MKFERPERLAPTFMLSQKLFRNFSVFLLLQTSLNPPSSRFIFSIAASIIGIEFRIVSNKANWLWKLLLLLKKSELSLTILLLLLFIGRV